MLFFFPNPSTILTVRTTQKIAMGETSIRTTTTTTTITATMAKVLLLGRVLLGNIFVCLVGGFWLWCLSFFLSFFLSFSVQNSFFHFYLLLARYEKRIKNQGQNNNKIVTFYLSFSPKTTTRRRNDERKNFDAL